MSNPLTKKQLTRPLPKLEYLNEYAVEYIPTWTTNVKTATYITSDEITAARYARARNDHSKTMSVKLVREGVYAAA
jgi:hypothetical protein